MILSVMLSGCALNRTGENETNSEITDTKLHENTSQNTAPLQDRKNQNTETQNPESTDISRLEENHPKVENCVSAQWAEDVFTDLSDNERYALGMDEPQPLIYFSTENTVEDFKVLSLTFESIDDDGNVKFTVEEIYNCGTMTPEEPQLIRMELMGTIPNNGISYVDTNGQTRYFAVEVSGYDGSLMLTEFTL